MGQAADAEVIILQLHPMWISSRKHACERREAMRRHPSFLACPGGSTRRERPTS